MELTARFERRLRSLVGSPVRRVLRSAFPARYTPVEPPPEKSGLVVAAFPRSASQQMAGLIEAAAIETNLVRPKICDGFGHTFITEAKIPRAPGRHVVVFGHLPYNGHNRAVIRGRLLDPKAILVVRPLPDVVVSYADYIERTGRGALDYDVPGLIDGFIDTADLTRDQLFDRVIGYTLPWYVRMVCSWIHAGVEFPLDVYTFEEHTHHPAATIENVLAFAGIDARPDALVGLSDAGMVPKINFNLGIIGRGFQELSTQQLARIRELLAPVGHAGPLSEYLYSGYTKLGFSAEDVIAAKARGTRNPLCDAPPSRAMASAPPVSPYP